MKISYKIPLIGTGIIVTAFTVFAGFQYLQIRNNTLEQTQINLSETADALGSEVNIWLNSRLSVVKGMAELLLDDASDNHIASVIGSETFADLASYYYVGRESDGSITFSVDGIELPEGYDARARPWYLDAKNSDTAIITEPYIDATDHRLLVTAAANIVKNGQLKGVLGADIELKAISDALNTVNFNNTGYAFIVDETGKIITHPKKSLFNRNIKDMYNGKIPNLTGNLQQTSIAGQAVLTGFYPIKNFSSSKNSWLVGLVVDEQKIMTPATSLGKMAVITAVLVVILSSLIFYVFMRSALIQPVNALHQQADEISHGRFTENLVGLDRSDEIGELAQAIQRLQKSLILAMTRLKSKKK